MAECKEVFSMIEKSLTELSVQLSNFSEDEKFYRFVPAGITAVRYVKEQFDELYRRNTYDSFSNKKYWSACPYSFFVASAKPLPAESTNQDVLSNLMQDLAKKITEIKSADHSAESLNTFIKNITTQLTLFKTSAHTSPRSSMSQDFPFLSNFRKRKITKVREDPDSSNHTMSCA